MCTVSIHFTTGKESYDRSCSELSFVSNALVPTQHMPGVLRAIADCNPVSAVTAAVSQPEPVGLDQSTVWRR